jgi:RimJ/RimL family protein N-acetyltransferase
MEIFNGVPGEGPVLSGTRVRLEPLAPGHGADLAVAGEEDRGSYGYTKVPGGADVNAYLDGHFARVKAANMAPFAQVRVSDGRAVGVTALWEPRRWPDRDGVFAVEIGHTWLAASAQRTGMNVEAKLLLMEYAFETVGVARVDIKTDARNERSRTAITRLGARFEGVLRNWQPSGVPGEDGKLRDTAMFSVIDTEWPDIKAGLTRRLAAHSG